MYELLETPTMYFCNSCAVRDKLNKIRVDRLLSSTSSGLVTDKDCIPDLYLDKLLNTLATINGVKGINKKLVNKDRFIWDENHIYEISLNPHTEVYEGTRLTKVNILKKRGYKNYRLVIKNTSGCDLLNRNVMVGMEDLEYRRPFTEEFIDIKRFYIWKVRFGGVIASSIRQLSKDTMKVANRDLTGKNGGRHQFEMIYENIFPF